MARTNMGVQRTATKRNQLAESVSHYLFNSVFENLDRQGLIEKDWLQEVQALFESPLTRDKWDHRLIFREAEGPGELWGQTTCYKGHDTGMTESNKTYEVRETLTEALCLRAMHPNPASVRLVHITYGNPDYVYSWFRPMKDQVFDLSLYIHSESKDIFDLMQEAIGSSRTEREIQAALNLVSKDRGELGVLLNEAQERLLAWWVEERKPRSNLGEEQAELIRKNFSTTSNSFVVTASGQNQKKMVVDHILGSGDDDAPDAIKKVASGIIRRKPFLATAKSHISNWEDFVSQVEELLALHEDFKSGLAELWSSENRGFRESIRRILLKIYSTSDIDYVQDLGVPGLSEHNLYSGDHAPSQINSVVSVIKQRLQAAGLTPTEFLATLRIEGKAILRTQLFFEAKNGTSSTSSFDLIVQDLLAKGYTVESPTGSDFLLLGFHAELTGQNVRPYTNFKLVKNQAGDALCLLKAKFFSSAEFDRRCKEEGFVGLSLSSKWNGIKFSRRFSVPLVMYVDMPEGLRPPDFSVRKLQAMGWDVAFTNESLVEMIGLPR